jgi:uncharacterized phage-associated protein
LKLIFLFDKYHLVKYGRTVTGDWYAALPDGPVPSTVYDILKDVVSGEPTSEYSARTLGNLAVDKRFQYPRFAAQKPFDARELSVSEIAALDHVIKVYGSMNFFQLKAITHEMIAYKKAWKKEKAEDKDSYVMAIEDFFEQDPDAISGAKEEMLEDDQLRKVFPLR